MGMKGGIAKELKRQGWSDDLIAKAAVGGKPIGEVRGPEENRDRMNKTEALFSLELEALKRAGQIKAWAFESITFRLADRTRYTPDFAVWRHDGTLQLSEIKGAYVRDDAGVKFKVAREQYPHFDWICWQRTKAGWRELFIRKEK